MSKSTTHVSSLTLLLNHFFTVTVENCVDETVLSRWLETQSACAPTRCNDHAWRDNRCTAVNIEDSCHASSSDEHRESCMSRTPELDKLKLRLSVLEVHIASTKYLWLRASSARLSRSQHFARSATVSVPSRPMHDWKSGSHTSTCFKRHVPLRWGRCRADELSRHTTAGSFANHRSPETRVPKLPLPRFPWRTVPFRKESALMMLESATNLWTQHPANSATPSRHRPALRDTSPVGICHRRDQDSGCRRRVSHAAALLRFRHAGKFPPICLRLRLPPPLLLPHASFSFGSSSRISSWLRVVMAAFLLSVPFRSTAHRRGNEFFWEPFFHQPLYFFFYVVVLVAAQSSISQVLITVCPSTVAIFFFMVQRSIVNRYLVFVAHCDFYETHHLVMIPSISGYVLRLHVDHVVEEHDETLLCSSGAAWCCAQAVQQPAHLPRMQWVRVSRYKVCLREGEKTTDANRLPTKCVAFRNYVVQAQYEKKTIAWGAGAQVQDVADTKNRTDRQDERTDKKEKVLNELDTVVAEYELYDCEDNSHDVPNTLFFLYKNITTISFSLLKHVFNFWSI